MCRVPKTTTNTSSKDNDPRTDRYIVNPKVRLLVTIESFHHDEIQKSCLPNTMSCLLTTLIVLLGLFISEYITRYIIYEYRYLHPLLDNPTNRYILARHIGVDTVCCIICVLLGYTSRHICIDVFYAVFGSTNKTKVPRTKKTSENDKPMDDNNEPSTTILPMHPSHYKERLLQFHAGAFRLALFFLIYQIKNTYDTILWQDGPEFIFHHVFSMITAYGCMFAPTIGHLYAIFFFGLSELSTAILCLLANFDDDHGVPGLGTALPMVKIILAVAFTITFIGCRVLLWPIFAYYFCHDVLLTLQYDQEQYNKAVTKQQQQHTTTYHRLPRKWMYFFLISLSGISCLQVLWLGQIFSLGKMELQTMGYI